MSPAPVFSLPSSRLSQRLWLTCLAIALGCASPSRSAAAQAPARAQADSRTSGDSEPFDEDAQLAPDELDEAPQDTAPTQPGTQEGAKPKEPEGPPPSTDAMEGEDELSLEEWERDDWQVVRPRVSLIDASGYLRLRGDTFRRLDFDNDSVWEYDRSTALPRYAKLNDNHAQFNQVSMRLRFEPRLNVSDTLQIWSTIDVLDNLAFGQTSWSMTPRAPAERSPVHLTSTGQAPMRRGVNSFNDNIVVKRLWARATFLNEQLELRVGRMPDHFGLGMFYNNGDCLNCDRGTVVDRLAVSFRALGHVFTPQVDWISRGPMHQAFGYFDPSPTDAVGWDNVMQYALRITRDDHPDDIRDRTAHSQWVVNYGLSNAVRLQGRDFPASYYAQSDYSPLLEPTANNLTGFGEERNGVLYQGDAYARVFAHNLELGAEVVVVAGSFKDLLAGSGTEALTTHILQVGAAGEATYHFREDRRGLRADFRLGGASGDGRRGFGTLDATDTQRGPTAGGFDTRLHNFQFSPDYHIDMILFRRLLGTITDAWYLRPELAYRFDDKLSGRVATIYSQAMTGGSVPAATASAPGGRPLGLEVDAELAYGLHSPRQRGQLLASLAGAMLFPFSAFDNNTAARPLNQRGGHFAWTLQARMYLTF